MEQEIDAPLPMCLQLPPITMQELIFQLRVLKPQKAPGPDNLTPKAIKFLPFQGVKLLLHLFNSILRLGHFPETWKMARVVMIAKPGKPTSEINSYRPISILSVLSKIFERLVLNRMLSYMDGVIPDHQFGFRAGHGTPEQCHRIVEFIKTAFENRRGTGI